MNVAPLPVDAERLFRLLAQHIDGDLLTDTTSRYLYSTDASYHLIVPMAVARPRHAADLQAIASTLFQFNSSRPPEDRVGLIMRSAGTSLTGGSIGRGLVVDVTKYLNRIIDLDVESRSVRVQPGVTYDELSGFLERHRLMFPPNPASGIACELGGMWANNASGTRHVKYGPTRDWVMSLEAVSSQGDRFRTHAVSAEGHLPPHFEDTLQARWAEALWPLVRDRQDVIVSGTPRVSKNASGYALDRLWRDGSFDFTQLLVGSEGTLALFSEADLALAEIPPCRAVALLFFDSWERAGAGVAEALPLEPVAVEMVDRHLLEIARPRSAVIRQLVPGTTETALLVEFEGDEDGFVRSRIEQLIRCVIDTRHLAFGHRIATDPAEQERLWAVRKSAAMIGHMTEGLRKPVPFIEDCVVRAEDLPAYIREISAVFERHNVRVAYWGHAGNGNMHVRPALDLTSPQDLEAMQAITDEVFAIVDRYGGSYTAEHGDGYTHSHLLARKFGPLYELFRTVKRVCDPLGFLNPDKIITARGDSLTTDLRRGPGDRIDRSAENRVVRDPHAIAHIENCIGLGVCKDFCPSFVALRNEQDLTRGRTNAMRGMMTGAFGDPDAYLRSREFRAMGDTCLNCKRCAFQCPSQVDEPRHLLLARRYVVEKEGMNLIDRLFSNYEQLAPWGVRMAPLANRAGENSALRRILEWTLGIDHRRRLPRFARETLDRWHARREAPRNATGTVVYFPGCFARYNEPKSIGRDVVRTAELLGYRVVIPATRCSGHALETYGGDLGPVAKHNIEVLEQAGDVPILTSCSSCRLSLVKQYPEWFWDDSAWEARARAVAVRVVDAAYFASQQLKGWPGLAQESIAYHAPCHALLLSELGHPGGAESLRAGATHAHCHDIPQHCSGMGGTFGFKRSHRTITESNGRRMEEPLEELSPGVEILTDCPSCRLALEEHDGRRVGHPIGALYRWLCRERNLPQECEET